MDNFCYSSESSDDHDLSDHEKLRQRRLAFFDKNPEESMENKKKELKLDTTKTNSDAFKANPENSIKSERSGKAEKEKSFRRQSKTLKDPNYDYPKYPPRPVSPNFHTRKPTDLALVRSATLSQLSTKSSLNENSKVSKAQDYKTETNVKNQALNVKYKSSQLISEINKLVDDEFDSIMNASKSEVQMTKESHPFQQNKFKLELPKNQKKAFNVDDSTDYEHIYCEVNVKSKPSLESNISKEASFLNGDNKMKPSKVAVKGNLDQPVRPSRGKLLKKATSLDADCSRTTTPSSQIFDRPNRQTVQQNQRLRSASGDQV